MRYPEACTCFVTVQRGGADGLTRLEGSTATAARAVESRRFTAWTHVRPERTTVAADGDARHAFAAMEDPMPLGRHGAIPLREVSIRASRSSGPGGQHANVTASRIEASFDVLASPSLTDAQKRRILARLGPRVVAVAQDERSQSRNRKLALERLRRRLTGALEVRRARRPTRPSPTAERRRLEAKRRQAERKRARRPPGGDD